MDIQARPTYLLVNLENIVFNLKKILEIQSSMVMPVIKADAYGLGAIRIARKIETLGVDRIFGFGVSTVEEALSLRDAGVSSKIMILGSIYPFKYAYDCIKNSIILPAFSIEAIREINSVATRAGIAANIHLKVDTGMGRLGVSVEEAKRILNDIHHYKAVKLAGIFSHFSSVNDHDFTLKQLKIFSDVISGLNLKYIHIANSGGLLRYKNSHYTLTRPGIALYGISPFPGENYGLKRVIEFRTKIVFLKKLPAGSPVSYARTFITKRDSVIATVPVGYADGYPRSFSNKAYAVVNGKPVPQAGRVTMDHTMFDVTGVPCRVGDDVILIGDSPDIYEVSKWAGTIPYEIMTGISKRVPRIYVE